MYKYSLALIIAMILGSAVSAQVSSKATISANIVIPVGVELEDSPDSKDGASSLKVISNESYSVTIMREEKTMLEKAVISEEKLLRGEKTTPNSRKPPIQSITINFE